METKEQISYSVINNWKEQFELFGLDYSTSVAKIGDYSFDIRYDCDLFNPKNKPDKCGLVLWITYLKSHRAHKFGGTLEELKLYANNWFKNELTSYHDKYFTLLNLKNNVKQNKMILPQLGERVSIPVSALEFNVGSHTIWVQSENGTVLRLKCTGKINIDACKMNPSSHSDIMVEGDINFCLSNDIM